MNSGNYCLWAVSGADVPSGPLLVICPSVSNVFVYIFGYLTLYSICAFEQDKHIAQDFSKFPVQMQ